MRRRHLVELEDLEWFPAVLRDGATACLRALGKTGRMGRFMAEPLAGALRKTGHRRLIDLCSGGAGPLPEVIEALGRAGMDVRAVMTDKFPNVAALRHAAAEGRGRVEPCLTSVDATDVPDELDGLRTLFNAFHHFPPELARGILADAVRKKVPIAVFEVVERAPWAVASVLLWPFAAMLLMPWIQPRRPAWWLFTYLLPLIPALLLWDGLVSCLRVYSPDELRELISGIDGHDTFDWSVQRVWMLPLPLRSTILIGSPRD
jgi:hypothetical protein